jgi:hypothetical protein
MVKKKYSFLMFKGNIRTYTIFFHECHLLIFHFFPFGVVNIFPYLINYYTTHILSISVKYIRGFAPHLLFIFDLYFFNNSEIYHEVY